MLNGLRKPSYSSEFEDLRRFRQRQQIPEEPCRHVPTVSFDACGPDVTRFHFRMVDGDGRAKGIAQYLRDLRRLDVASVMEGH